MKSGGSESRRNDFDKWKRFASHKLWVLAHFLSTDGHRRMEASAFALRKLSVHRHWRLEAILAEATGACLNDRRTFNLVLRLHSGSKPSETPWSIPFASDLELPKLKLRLCWTEAAANKFGMHANFRTLSKSITRCGRVYWKLTLRIELVGVEARIEVRYRILATALDRGLVISSKTTKTNQLHQG